MTQLHPPPPQPSQYLRGAHDAAMVTKTIFAAVGTMMIKAHTMMGTVFPRMLDCCDEFTDALKLTVDVGAVDGSRLNAGKASHQKAYEVFGRLVSGLLVVGKPAPELEFANKLNAAQLSHQEVCAAQRRYKDIFTEKLKEEEK